MPSFAFQRSTTRVSKANFLVPSVVLLLGLLTTACHPKAASKSASAASECVAPAGAETAPSIGSHIDPAVPRMAPWLVNLQCNWTDLTTYRIEDDKLEPTAGYDENISPLMKPVLPKKIVGTDIKLFEVSYLYLYTQNDFKQLNRSLRAQATTPIPDADAVEIKAISSFLNKIEVKKDVKVYRGVNLDAATLGISTVGQIYVADQLFSTSLDMNVAFRFGNAVSQPTVFEIDANTISNVSGFTDRTREKEVLFPPGTSFKVDSIGPSPLNPKYTLVKMTQIDRAAALANGTKAEVIPLGCDQSDCTEGDAASN